MSVTSLLDAVRVVKENERTAAQSYLTASWEIWNPMGRKLFEELSDFENYHFKQLSALEKSLEESGEYIEYKGREFPLPPVLEAKAAQEPESKSVMKIINEAIELEREAESAYADLAAQTTDKRGRAMFERLSEEERGHYRLLKDAYWSLTNLGAWKFSQPPGKIDIL